MVMPERHLDHLQVMMSLSNSPDLGTLRMGEQHFEEATKEIARHLLADGAALAYGGDLRQRGFTRLLFDLALTYNASVPEGGNAKIISYLASPVWEIEGGSQQVELGIRRAYRGAARAICLPSPNNVHDELSGKPYDPGNEQELSAMALTAMRRRMISDSQAIVCLGGRVTGYSGRYPGVLEEIALSLMASRSVYLLGGFGGCASDAARAIMGTSPIAPDARRLDEDYGAGYAEAMDVIGQYSGKMPANGLSLEENRTLANQSEIHVVIPLLLRGLRSVGSRK